MTKSTARTLRKATQMIGGLAVLMSAWALSIPAAYTESRETLLSYRDWQVRNWETDGGDRWCLAEAKTDAREAVSGTEVGILLAMAKSLV